MTTTPGYPKPLREQTLTEMHDAYGPPADEAIADRNAPVGSERDEPTGRPDVGHDELMAGPAAAALDLCSDRLGHRKVLAPGRPRVAVPVHPAVTGCRDLRTAAAPFRPSGRACGPGLATHLRTLLSRRALPG